VRERFQVTMDIQIVFDQPTIRGMAEAIETSAKIEADEPALVPVPRTNRPERNLLALRSEK
jgi:hypothetical protein